MWVITEKLGLDKRATFWYNEIKVLCRAKYSLDQMHMCNGGVRCHNQGACKRPNERCSGRCIRMGFGISSWGVSC